MAYGAPRPQIDLVIIESNPADSYLAVQGLKQAGLERVRVFEDAEKALQEIEGGSVPDLICMDLNVPPFSGVDLLERVRAHPNLRLTPVVVVSGSENSELIRQCYQCGANCYIKKPSSLGEFMRFMRAFYEFWATVVTLPPKPVNQSSATGRVK
ncbi:MAG: response regulator [Bryobacteraceae bacterium]